MILNPSEFSANQIYHIMTQSVIPRPIAWVLTDSGNENYNLAPFSYFTAIASAPPLLMFSVGKKPTGEIKDTVRNVKSTRKMVIHIAQVDDAELVTKTAATLDHGESEVEINKIELTEFEHFDMPRVANCPIAFGCELYQTQEIGETPQTLVFAEIKQIYISDDTSIQDAKGRLKIEANKVAPLARLGGGEYSAITAPFGLTRPK